MRRRASSQLLCLLGTLACAALPARAQFLSPGELSAAHGSIEGDAHCFDCHSTGRRVETGLCTKCHGDIAGSLRAGTGLHGKPYRGKPCGECHVEHRGSSHDLVRWPGGAQARFDHALTGFVLAGAHQKAGCRDCHERKNERGAATFLGLSQRCSSCHEDPHDKRFGSECKSCHDESTWKRVDLARFDHALARFPLRGKHAQVECASCHETPPKYRGLEFQSCTSCHQDPHQGELGTTCTNCHSEQSWQKVSMKRSAHPGLSLAGGHAAVRCQSCHDRGNDQPPSRGKRCVSCHSPVHEAKFGNDCADCHKHVRWLGLPEEIGRDAHAKTAFALRGLHQKVECSDCHAPKLPPRQRFRELAFGRCLDCHEDPHRGEFAARDGGECGPCHAEHGFTPTLFGTDAHASTAFALEGRHSAAACGRCHAGAHPRLDLRVPQQQCADCHQNPHGDQFAAEMRSGGCAHCHSPVAWSAPNIDHRTWPLTGAHALAQCSSCHDPSEADRKAGRGASYRGVARDCEGCHDDVHLGQFRLGEPLRACGFCHGTEAFTIARFDHVRLAGYPLQGAHEHVECEDCHAQQTLRNGLSTVRYRLGYVRCADCHRSPHEEAKP